MIHSGKWDNTSYEILELPERTVPNDHRNRTYPILIKSKTRCWGCHALFETLHRCTRCFSVRYCSKKCQAKHWKAPEGKNHRSICRPSTFYDTNKDYEQN